MTDFAGWVIRAAIDADSGPAILAALDRLGIAGEGPCTVLGMSCRLGAGAAAVLNGAFGLSLDFDDTHADRYLHPTAPVIAAAGRLMRLTFEQMMSAFGVVASHASGSLQFLQNGAWNKHYQMDEAAMKGLIISNAGG